MDELVVGGATRVWRGSRPDADAILGDARPGRIAVLVQAGVPAGIGDRVAAAMSGAAPTLVVAVPDGEPAKTMAGAEEVCRALAVGGVERGDLVVGVGGGALTDLAGFVAGVFLRGIRVHLIPTTLLGAIDAAIGGKSGVNLDGKNLVGLFRHPARVVIDLDVLGALPAPLMRQGAAEAFKAGMIGDPALVDLYEAQGISAPIDQVVDRALRVKAGIVERDPFEAGERAHLNYGHTVGHAVELAAGVSHGEAIAVGMIAAGHASARIAGFQGEERQRDILARLGLPVSAVGLEAGAVRRLMAVDKKRSGGSTRMVLLADIARPRVVVVDDATVTAALGAVGIGGGSP